jgi:hypothetical protein
VTSGYFILRVGTHVDRYRLLSSGKVREPIETAEYLSEWQWDTVRGTHAHCVNASSVLYMNSGLRTASLHEPPCDAATVKVADVPPVLKPVASDMDRRNCVPFRSGSWYWKDPLPF